MVLCLRRSTTKQTREPRKRGRRGVADLWYKDAIIYQLHVKSFFDGNNDGIGDFPGLISKLDYIAMDPAVLSFAAI